MASLSTRAAKLIKLTLDFETSDFNVYFDILVESRWTIKAWGKKAGSTFEAHVSECVAFLI